jgi:hypothetical protein
MYWPDKNVFTIDIPKTACVTRWNVAKEIYRSRTLSGHMTMSFAADRMAKKLDVDYRDVEFWTVIRHPERRLLSSINYHYKQLYKLQERKPNIDNYLSDVRDSKYWNGTVYRSQSSWLDLDDVEVRLWPLERYSDFLAALGWDQPVPVKNESPKTWSMDQLRESQHYELFMSKYEDDWNLYQKALNNFADLP